MPHEFWIKGTMFFYDPTRRFQIYTEVLTCVAAGVVFVVIMILRMDVCTSMVLISSTISMIVAGISNIGNSTHMIMKKRRTMMITK